MQFPLHLTLIVIMAKLFDSLYRLLNFELDANDIWYQAQNVPILITAAMIQHAGQVKVKAEEVFSGDTAIFTVCFEHQTLSIRQT